MEKLQGKLQLNWQNDKLVLWSGLLGAIAAVSMLFLMIFLGFFGWQVFWMLIGAACVGIAYLVTTKTLTKYTAGFAFLALSLGGALIHLLIGYGLEILLSVFLFVTLVTLFGHFYIVKDATIYKITALAAGLFAFCHLLPFGAGGRLPLQGIFDLFKYSFFNALLSLILLFVAVALCVFIIMDLIKAQLPMPIEDILKIGMFTIAGIIFLTFLVSIFQTAGFKHFMATLFMTLFTWSIGMIAGFSFYVMKEGQEGSVLQVKK
jgi:hypothetical protein